MRNYSKFSSLLFVILFLYLPIGQTKDKHGLELYGAVEQIDITPRKGTPIAGFGGGKRRIIPWDIFGRYPYAKYFKPHKGQHDSIRAKVLLLKKNNEHLLFISLDLVGTISHFKKHLIENLKELNIKSNNIFITSTHTHSGPGALTYNKLWELMAMDKFNKKIYGEFMAKLITTVKLANTNLEPVELYTKTFEVEGIQKNRAKLHKLFDKNANILLVKSQEKQAWLGGMVNLALHGTALGMSNLAFSGDVLGQIERSIESMLKEKNMNSSVNPTILFINGALGDVSPTAGGLDGMTKMAKSFTEQLIPNMESLERVEPNWTVHTKEIYLGKPGLSLYNCARKSFLGKILGWSSFLRRKRLGFKKWLPKKEKISLIKLGDILFMTWPGEPTSKLGFQLKDLAFKKAKFAWVMGLTNNHLAYFVTPEEEKMTTKEACNSFYTSLAGKRIISGYAELIETLEVD